MNKKTKIRAAVLMLLAIIITIIIIPPAMRYRPVKDWRKKSAPTARVEVIHRGYIAEPKVR